MESIQQIPEWFGTAMLGAIIASIGYVLKLLLSWWDYASSNYRTNKARLVELYSMLCATKVAFDYQAEIRDRLHDTIEERDNTLVQGYCGYENIFSNAYSSMSNEELELHAIIQSYTEYVLYPLNVEILDWLKKDTFFKSRKWQFNGDKSLDLILSDLEGHLHLWVAKYKIWIPNQPSHALVYLADENKHGLGFPTGIEKCIEQTVAKKHWLFG